jgi:XTP/dITP diphosphohydrolase
MKKLLIATTNKNKVKEIKPFFETLPFEIVCLDDLTEKFSDPEETENSLEGNALLKAKYYGLKTGLLSLAEDSGLFVDALDGYPGIKSARISNTKEGRNENLLENMKDLEGNKRKATFRSAIAIYNPKTKNSFISFGETEGKIEKEAPKDISDFFGYDPIFTELKTKKRYSEMEIHEKNALSHRGKSLSQAKYYLTNQYLGKHIVVPCSMIIDKENKKILLAKRNDPHNSDFHGKWEFSGGSMEIDESLEENLIREIQEECGYTVKVEKRLSEIGVFPFHHPEGLYSYQVYLMPHLCTIVSGDGNFSKEEVMELKWVDIEDVVTYDLISENKVLFENVKEEILEWCKK